MAEYDCFCGCGREVPRSHRGVNLLAANVALELFYMDRLRFFLEEGMSEGDNTEIFIADGADLFSTTIEILHGEVPLADFPRREINRWLKFSRKSRKKIGRATGLVPSRKTAMPPPDEFAYLDQEAPWKSWTGNPELREMKERVRAEARDAD